MSITPAPRIRRVGATLSVWAALAAAVSFAACSGGGDSTSTPTGPSTPATPTPSAIAAVGGSGQSATTGSTVAQALVARVTSAAGAPLAGVSVAFQVTSGFATLSSTTISTDGAGEARVLVTTGTTPGAIVITATAQGVGTPATFSLTATAPPVVAVCAPATAMAPGAAIVLTTATVCLPGGASSAAEYGLVPFNAATSPRSTPATVTFTGTNVTAVTTPLTTASLISADPAEFAGTLTRLARYALRTNGTDASMDPPRHRLEYRMPLDARARLTAMLPAARAWHVSRAARAGRAARLSLIPGGATVGSLLTLSTTGTNPCTATEPRTGRVAAVGRRAIVLADTLNPAGGFTTADYAAIAATFDDVVHVVDTKNFGDPTDIDGNEHVVLFFTTAVNGLTPRGSRGYIGGFFAYRDLYPKTATPGDGFEGCAGSNEGEMFYLLAPDPSGTVNGNVFSKEFARVNALATTAHEYQHLINASRRMYVNLEATDYEETWLDEGLAHSAEELLFYARSGLGPRTNIDGARLAANATYSSLFFDDAVGDFDLLGLFLEAAPDFSPYPLDADVDLETRGAAWSLLRYIADQTTPIEQEKFWMRVVNSSRTGLVNLREVVGDPTPLIRDWATTLLLDDVTGASARYQFPSWNLRSIFGAITTIRALPLGTTGLGSDAARSVRIAPGSAGYVRFSVAPGTAGSVSITAPSPLVQTTLVRLR